MTRMASPGCSPVQDEISQPMSASCREPAGQDEEDLFPQASPKSWKNQVWNVYSGRVLLTYTKHTGRVYEMAWSPDGTRLASCSDDRTVQVWQVT